MTHQALARKWRPRDFSSVVGQDHVVKALVHALDHDRLHHAYLLTGTRGVGKTTLARILAKAVNCEVSVSSKPCGVCSACTGIDTGRYPDYLELDAASNRSVDEMTQVLETAVYAPSMGRYKVYVIDEVHMLSNHAFNAMLKTLEEPPRHVLFVLATTDPQKVPVTVLSRCLQLGLKNMTASAIAGHLAGILQKESIPFESDALAWIGKAARGSMRDALSLTDQAITYSSGQVRDAATREMLGIVPGDQVLGIFEALAQSNASQLLAIADQMQAQAASFAQALMQIAERCQALAWLKQGVALPEPDDQMQVDFERFDALDLQALYQIAVHGARDLGLAPDPYTGFTMSLLRLLAFTTHDAQNNDAVPKRPAQPLTARRAIQPAIQPVATQSTPSSEKASFVAIQKLGNIPKQGLTPNQETIPREETKPKAGLIERAPAKFDAPIEQVAALGSTRVEFNGDWPSLAASLPIAGAPRMFAQQSLLVDHSASSHGMIFCLKIGVKVLAEPANVAKVKEALQARLGCPVQIKVELGEVIGETAASISRQAQDEKIAQTQTELESLPFVKSVMDHLGGKIVPGSVKPA